MNRLLQSWLDELREDGLHLSVEAGAGASENLWCISWSSSEQIELDELVAFLQSAASIRRELAASQAFRPVTFYAWHDELAGQLRFSTARCASNALPFSAKVVLVHDPRPIVASFVQSPYRDGIPLNDLGDVVKENATAVLGDSLALHVWAADLV